MCFNLNFRSSVAEVKQDHKGKDIDIRPLASTSATEDNGAKFGLDRPKTSSLILDNLDNLHKQHERLKQQQQQRQAEDEANDVAMVLERQRRGSLSAPSGLPYFICISYIYIYIYI